MTIRTIRVDDALVGEDYRPSGPLDIVIDDGRIAALVQRRAEERTARRLLAMPSLVDAHNHARPLSTTSFGTAFLPLELWLPRLATIPAVNAGLAARASFGRTALGGCSGVMVHLTRPMGHGSLAEEACEIATAAHEVGLSIGFAVALRDRNPIVYGEHAPLLDALTPASRAAVERVWASPVDDVEVQLEQVDAVAGAVVDLPGHIDVQYGPTGVQWCSEALLRGVADASRRSGRRVHMHLLETEPQRRWADTTYPDGVVEYLAHIGLLSPRLTLAHGVWCRPDELALIAGCGARIAVNPSSNLHLGSGIADVRTMRKAGVAVAVGLDGAALDEDDDALRELRLLRFLNGPIGFGEGMAVGEALRAACAVGREVIGLPTGGTLSQGAPADIALLDLDALDRDAIVPLDPRELLMSRAEGVHLVELIAGGRTIVADGTVSGFDLEKVHETLRAAYREALAEWGVGRDELIDGWQCLEPAVRAFYTDQNGCC